MRARVQVSGGDRLAQRLRSLKLRLQRDSGVYVGVPQGAGQYEDGTPLAVIAAVHEFGANIKHPGGTKYVVDESGKAQFVSNSYSGDVAGTTGPHTIPIPERSFLRAPLRAGQDRFKTIFKQGLPDVVSGKLTMFQLMSQVGAAGAGTSQEAISQGIGPPNAPSTVKQKGSSKPLVDDGRLLQSITYIVGDDSE